MYFQASTDSQMSEYFNSILPFDLLTLELSFHVPSKQVSRRSGRTGSLSPLGLGASSSEPPTFHVVRALCLVP